MIDKSFIEKIEQLSQKDLINVGGAVFSEKCLNRVFTDVDIHTVTVKNLSGFCDFITLNIDKFDFKNFVAHVCDYNKVEFFSAIHGEKKNRVIPVQAALHREAIAFPFGEFLAQERFIVLFRSLFVMPKNAPDDDFNHVLSYTAKLSGGNQIEQSDDGITQKVTVNRGVSGTLKSAETIKPIVKLSPYRTFREAVQPQSEFLFRVRLDKENNPTVGLFEADGGAWINTAMANIAAYIKEKVPGINVIA